MEIEENQEINSPSDLSYDSSYDEKDPKDKKSDPIKNIQLFKEQMFRFLLTHPELQEEIKFDKFEFDYNAYIDYSQDKKPLKQKQEDKKNSDEQNLNKHQTNPIWMSLTNNIIQDNKKTASQAPSIEHFTQRMNIFRKKIEKPDVIDMIINNKDYLLAQIQKEEYTKQKSQNKNKEVVEAKLRMESGMTKDVQIHSLRKQYEWSFRLKKKEEQMRKEQEEQEKKENIAQQGEKNEQQQQQQQEKKNKKQQKKTDQQQINTPKGLSVFDRLQAKNMKNNLDDSKQEREIPLNIKMKTQKGEELLKVLKKAKTEEERKRLVIKMLEQHKEQTLKELKDKPALISQGQKYFSEDSKEYNLLSPNLLIKKQIKEKKDKLISEMKDKGIAISDEQFFEKEFFDYRSNLEDGNVYLLTKVNQILSGSLMKKWKELQDQKL